MLLITRGKLLNSKFISSYCQINDINKNKTYNGDCSSTVEYRPVASETRVRLPPIAFEIRGREDGQTKFEPPIAFKLLKIEGVK